MKITYTEAFPSEVERGSKRFKENSTQTTSMCLDLKESVSLKTWKSPTETGEWRHKEKN